jgi:hypothetical protein
MLITPKIDRHRAKSLTVHAKENWIADNTKYWQRNAKLAPELIDATTRLCYNWITRPSEYQMLSKTRRLAVAISIISGLSMIAVASDQAMDEAQSASEKTAAAEKPKKQKKEKTVAAKADKTEKAEKSDKADKTAKGDKRELAPVLEPSQFYGRAAIGYASAKACPEVVANLFCYCGCDVTDKHSSLLDCFTSYHGVDCHICQEEAEMALKMHRDGATMAQIQEAIDQKYSHEYPFSKDTDTYTNYKANRLWKQTSDQQSANTTNETPSTGSNTKAGEPPKLKPGAKVGNCCAAGHKKEKKEKSNK